MAMNTPINHGDLKGSETSGEGEAVIDQEVLLEFCRNLEGNEGLIQEMVTLFLADAPKQLLAAHQAVARRDSKELGRIAHTLRGSSSYYGAKRLAKPCTELEENCERGNLVGADSLLAQVEKEFVALREALQPMIFQPALINEAT